MERKKRSKGRGWESCYVKTIYGTFGVEMRAYGQKLVQFCTHTHTRVSFSSIDEKAFDSIEFNPLFEAIENQLVEATYITLLRDIYNGATSSLKSQLTFTGYYIPGTW